MTTPDYRALCAELIEASEAPSPTRFFELRDRARAALAAQPQAPSDEELEADFRSWWKDCHNGTPYFGAVPLVECIAWTHHALARYGTATPAPVPVGERLPELRGMFERTIAVAQASQDPVGHIQLADRLIDAVVHWALPLPGVGP